MVPASRDPRPADGHTPAPAAAAAGIAAVSPRITRLAAGAAVGTIGAMRMLWGPLAAIATVAGCSSASSGGAGTAPSCATSGSFTASVYEAHGDSYTTDACTCAPGVLSVTVAWQSDGSATVDGQSCAAYCASPKGAGLCRDLGEPAVQDGTCAISIHCCDPFGADAGLPPCPAMPNGSIGEISFHATAPVSNVQAVPAYSISYQGCTCSYCSSVDAAAGRCN